MTSSNVSSDHLTESRMVRSWERAGAFAALAASVLTILWLVTLAAAPPPAGGSAAEHLAALAANDFGHSLTFVVVLPIGLVLVPVWIALAFRSWRAHPVASLLCVAYGLLYAPLSTTAYWLQLTAARGLADAYRSDPTAAATAYQLLDFGPTTSVCSALDVLGYAVLGVGIIAAAVLLWSRSRLAWMAAAMFVASGGLSIAGAIGIALRWPWLEAAAIASGAPFLLAAIATTWLLWPRPSGYPAAASAEATVVA
jgi:hypothetical protein